MARKIKSFSQKQNYPTEPRIVWVKRANMYCKTWFEANARGEMIQHQEWLTKEEYERSQNINKGTGGE